jgi:NADH-quinone oxidoreductase subunit G
MGFDAVFDTNFGADVTIMEEASEFAARLREGAGPLPLITTCCPSWVDFMEKFHDDMIPHFSSCKSPHAIVGTLAKTYYADTMGIDPTSIRMVSIMPCTSKKYEIGRSDEMYASGRQDVDVSITTRELSRMIRQAGVDLGNLPDQKADSPLGDYSGAGTIFGATGGVTEAALRSAHYFLTGTDAEELEFADMHTLDGVKELEVQVAGQTVRVAIAHGLGNVEQVLETIRTATRAGEEPPYHLVEVMACPGGCIGGGGQSWGVTDAVRRQRAEGLLDDDRHAAVRRSHQNPAVQRIYKEFLDAPLSDKARELLHTQYHSRPEYKR